MPDTIIGLALFVIAVLPGAVYTWALERQVGGWGLNLIDRILRFISVSLLFHLVAAWPEYLLYRWALSQPARGRGLPGGQFAAIWGMTLLLVAIPSAVGTALGGLYASRASRSGWNRLRKRLSAHRETRVLQVLLGRNPVPRAWDNFFSEAPEAYLRIRTTDGSLIAGLFAARSYASGFPQEPDLYLEEAWGVDPASGTLTESLRYPMYVPGSQIAWFEVVYPDQESK